MPKAFSCEASHVFCMTLGRPLPVSPSLPTRKPPLTERGECVYIFSPKLGF